MAADDRPRPAARHRALLRDLRQRARRLHGHQRPGRERPRDRPALWPELPGDHDRRHGARPGAADRPPRHRAPVLRARRLDGRHAGAGVGGALPGARVQRGADRERRAPLGAEHRVPRGRPPGDHGRSRLAGRQLSPERPAADPRALGRAHGGAHHLPQRGRAAPQVRPRAAGPQRHQLRLRGRLPGRELPAPPGHHLRRPLRCQLLPLHHARDGLLRPRGLLRGRAGERLPRRRDPVLRDLVLVRLAVPDDREPRAGQGARRGRRQRLVLRDRDRPRPRLFLLDEPEFHRVLSGFLDGAAAQCGLR